ncbi:hypothetical protein HDU98_010652 [Podochytrium sp. JEL0797]|nr:hypothetical protein HDU98_010652 [Podochytrium sp. JEL0797]
MIPMLSAHLPDSTKTDRIATILSTLKSELNQCITSRATPTAHRIAHHLSHLGPLHVTLSASAPNPAAIHTLFETAFADEPLGLTCGKQGIAEEKESAANQVSVVVMAGDTAICYVWVECDAKPQDHLDEIDETKVYLDWTERLHDAFRYMDQKAHPELTSRGYMFDGAYELYGVAVDARFRGSLVGPASWSGTDSSTAKFTIFQRVLLAVEELVRVQGGKAMYSHSHDGSSVRQVECGWEVMQKFAYRKLPKTIGVNPAEGNMYFLWKSL